MLRILPVSEEVVHCISRILALPVSFFFGSLVIKLVEITIQLSGIYFTNFLASFLRHIDEKFALLKGPRKTYRKFETFSLERKVCNFEWRLVMSRTYTKSFGGKKSLTRRFFPSKVIAYA